MKLNSLEELYKEIEKDKRTNAPTVRRYPIRFLFLNSFKSLQNIVSHLGDKGINFIELTASLLNEDGWLTSNDIINIIKNIKQDTIIVPLSEILRFFNREDFFVVIKSLSELESRDNLRLYMPFVGLLERFEKDFWNNFYRKKNWAPIWVLNEPIERVSIYQVNYGAKNITNKEMISNSKEWLNLWKINDITKVISFSESLSYLYPNFLPDAMFDLKTISNQKEYLESFFNAKISIEFVDNESSFWDKLLREIMSWNLKDLNFEIIFLKHFNLNSLENLEIENYLKLYIEHKDSLDRWLLKNFLLYYEEIRNSYLFKMFNKLNSFSDRTLIDMVWFEIFEDEIKKDFFMDRKKLLKILHKDMKKPFSFIESKLEEKLECLNELTTKEKIKYLTDITFAEKRYIVKMVKDSPDFSEELKLVKEVYPELYYYLNWDNLLLDDELEPWISEYFKNYNISKITNKRSDDLKNILYEKNKDKDSFCEWYYKIEKIYHEEKNLIWVDSLGSEWFPLIIYLIEEYGKSSSKFIEKKVITRVNLPTITDCNKYETKKIDSLDKHIHNENPYHYPDDLIKEIEILKSIVKEILESDFESLGIVSDHGFTFLCQKQFNNIKKLNLKESNHEGRCMWIDTNSDYHDDEYFIVWTTDSNSCQGKKSLVALKHTSLQNTPSREVHGGATPEEVLVPYIVISTRKEVLEYRVEPMKFEVSIKDRIIKFKIHPNPQYTPKLKFGDEVYKLFYHKDGDLFEVNLCGLRTGTYNLELGIGDKQYKIEVEIKGGFKEKDLL
jgi:hypothetical protein